MARIGTVAVMSPGDMGHAVAKVLRAQGLRVITCLDGRSALGGAAGGNWPRPALGRKALDDPAVALTAVAQPVVEPARASLPELDPFGDHAVAAPELG